VTGKKVTGNTTPAICILSIEFLATGKKIFDEYSRRKKILPGF
jgi:hypothetical protein